MSSPSKIFQQEMQPCATLNIGVPVVYTAEHILVKDILIDRYCRISYQSSKVYVIARFCDIISWMKIQQQAKSVRWVFKFHFTGDV